MSGRNSSAISHEHQQIPSSAEEKTLVLWISRIPRAGFPALPALAIEMAEETWRSQATQLDTGRITRVEWTTMYYPGARKGPYVFEYPPRLACHWP